MDPRQLRVAEAVRLLNSTPLGEVVQPHVVYRHLNRAGYRIGDGKRLDLVRYAAWLFHERFAGAPAPGAGMGGYESMKEAANQRNRSISESARDIAAEGWVHDPVNPDRKRQCASSFRAFCESYFPQTFHLAWSPDHLKVIRKIEQAVLQGGLFAMAMPRGSGKTTLCETACLWSLLYGHREFVALIGSDEEHAAAMLDSIKSELENNDLIEEDFSEVCGPIRALEGIHQRAAGQLYKGARTHIGWTAKEITLPTIPGSAASSAIIKVAGITGRIRGMKHKRADGKTARPSLVLLDDPQTDESARSPSQCATREQILAGAILGLAGPGRKIAGLMTLTVVRPDDMADRILDREKHPQWQGERTKMVYAFPGNEKLWQEYARLRAEGQRNDRGTGEATEFYRANQTDMDAGAIAAWPQRHNPDELSAIQHAMNLKLDQGDAAFFAEYQNEPLPEDNGASDMLTADVIAAKTNGMKRGEVPVGVNHLSLFIDVQGNLLFWMLCGWEENFTGYVLDYGEYPDQKRPYFTLRDARRTLMTVHKSTGQEGAIYAGLDGLTRDLLERKYRRDDGAEMTVERCMVDANWGNSTDVVYQFCRQSPHAAVLLPSHGRYVGASSIPFSDYKPKKGDRVGLHWRVPNLQGKRAVRYALIDTNYWKSFVQAMAVNNDSSDSRRYWIMRVSRKYNAPRTVSAGAALCTGRAPRLAGAVAMTSEHTRPNAVTVTITLWLALVGAVQPGFGDEEALGKVASRPLFRDPVFDGAADVSLCWNRQEKKWFMLYTNRRANVPNLPGVAWVHGTPIGVAESSDGGATWNYRATAQIDLGEGDRSYWAPEVLWHDGKYHMFLTHVPGMHKDWSGTREIVHLVSDDLLKWTVRGGPIKLSSDRVIDACVYQLPDGTWRMWYNNEKDRKSIYYADSRDLETWVDKGKAAGDQPGEGPKVFRWKGRYWIIVDEWKGLALYSSDDALKWKRQPKRILDVPGKGEDDGVIGNHADVVVSGDRAFVFYFTHPGRTPGNEKTDGVEQRRSSIQVVELEVTDGEVRCDRDKPTRVKLDPPTTR